MPACRRPNGRPAVIKSRQRTLTKKRRRRIKAASTNTWVVSTVDLDEDEYPDEQPAVEQAAESDVATLAAMLAKTAAQP